MCILCEDTDSQAHRIMSITQRLYIGTWFAVFLYHKTSLVLYKMAAAQALGFKEAACLFLWLMDPNSRMSRFSILES